MNLAQTLDLRLNIEEQTPVVVPIHVECALPLHRLGKARRQEDISCRKVARHLGITVQDVQRQECNTTDLPLSALHKWAKVLGLPVAELVEEPNDSLSTPLFNRAGLVRVMKTAMAILERNRDSRTKRLAQTMVDQLLEIMPELRGVSAWPAVGKRRRLDDLGIAAERRLSDAVLMDVADGEGHHEP
jgi:transcriptional regulator with XRE-family HTH domain